MLEAANAYLNAADERERASAYDELLWRIVTAPRERLAAFATQLWAEPYHDLPVPLQVAALRLLGLESEGDAEALRQAAGGIALYCDPIEEAGATAGIRRLIEQADPKGGA